MHSWIDDLFYGPGLVVIGSDGNIYRALAKNIGLDPTTNPNVWRAESSTGVPSTPTGANVPVPQAGDAGKVVTVNAGATGYELDQGGTSVQGALITHKFAFTYATAGLLTGATAVFTDGYIPAVGDILHDAWFEIGITWDGTTPLGDAGTFPAGTGHQGWWQIGNAPIWMGNADVAEGDVLFGGTDSTGGQTSHSLAQLAVNNAGRSGPGRFLTADPIQVCVSQNGTTTGANPGATQGSAVLYIVTSTPHA